MNLPDKKTLLQFIKFGIVGVSNTLIALLIYYIFIAVNQSLYQVGNVIGWIISVANAFFWNNKYVFTSVKSKRKHLLSRLGKTYLSYGATFLLNTLLLFLEIDLWKWPATVSPIANLLLTIPLNFLLNKFWAFR